jgi:D-arabinose 1-dehydrogenase-like Zn-dependent alcohol dehydrogenase
MNRILVTTGNGAFYESEYDVPEITDHEIQVRSVMTGVCRSDIDMMNGDFGPLPLNMQGHEGLGQVIAVGSKVNDVSIGDFVATRGEPAYADVYNVRPLEYVKVPEAHPKYILEPVACGINVVYQALDAIKHRSGPGKRLMILGSGFLAWVAYNAILQFELDFDVTVVGSSNTEIWATRLQPTYDGKFDVVIDLSSKPDVFTHDIMNPEGLVVFGAQKHVSTDFGNLLWKACTIVFPSPRTSRFYQCMVFAEEWIRNNQLNIDTFWSNSYNRSTQWKAAFTEATARTPGYSRGYIVW